MFLFFSSLFLRKKDERKSGNCTIRMGKKVEN